MGFDPNIRRAIRKLANEKESQLKECEIYSAPQTARYFSGLSGTMQGNHKKALEVHIISDGKNGITACTDGQTVYANWENELFSRYATPMARFEAFSGGIFHEISHVLYMDFNESDRADSIIAQGRFFGAAPNASTKEEKESLAEMTDAMADERLRPVFRKIWGDLNNVLADRHDEDALMDDFGGLVTTGIYKIRESLHSLAEPFEDSVQMIADGKADRLAVAYDAVLQYSRFGSVFMYDDSLWETDEILQKIAKSTADIDDAVTEDGLEERYKYMNRIVLRLWPVIRDTIREMEQKKQSGDGGTESKQDPQQGQISPETVAGILNSLQQAAEKTETAPMPENRRTSEFAKEKVSANVGKKQGVSGEEQKSKEAMQSVLNSICGELAQQQAETEMEQILSSELATRISAVDQATTHRGIPLVAERELDDGDEAECDRITLKIRPYVARAVRYVEEALKDIQEGGLNKHRLFGRRLVVNEAYRPDGRYYANKKLPRDLPDMAISILVDNSGSMSGGGRIESAREAALMVYDFATALNIPVCVSGHTTFGDTVFYRTFSDYERANGKDRRRIASMMPSGCNRDGMALEIAANLLSRRPESYKLLFIISDGQPNHQGYGGDAAAADIQSIVKRYRNRGIEIIAAAIGDDRDLISSIYGDGFLDITDLAKLPKSMAKIIRKRILQQIA